MLTPEIALLAGTAGVFFSLLSCLLMLRSRRQMNQRIDELKLELDVHLSASHELAKHVRILQKTQKARAAEPEPEVEEDYGFGHKTEASRETGLSLAEKLGLSQSEADIITHLRPRKRGVRETV
jgi:hypothetical protein